ncbi:MAG: serine/threonine protein kinase [Gammaproteobacteria bacterium]|nr:serine/threonine protein kinase [Gammaproteobacteria bacterium]
MNNEEKIYRDVLPQGFELHWYEVKSVLGRGAFGVTYLARDKNLDQFVAIKEYFPNEFSTRESGYTVHPVTSKSKEMYEWGLNRFIREARTLAKFKYPNIVRVLSVFENNNTAYMVMEYERGNELSRLFREKKHSTEKELLDIFLPVMKGLKLVHDAGFIHRDIKPSNIYIRENGSPVLIDFGSARQVMGAPTRALTSLVTYGYAPFEQYNESEDKQGPWTDIYALGASLFFGLTRQLPIEALARGSDILSTGIDPYQPLSVTLAGKYSASFLRTIDHALLFHANERPQDVLVWANMLSGKSDVPELPAPMLESTHEARGREEEGTVIRIKKPESPTRFHARTTPQFIKRSSNTRLISILLITIIVFATGAALLFMLEEQGKKKDEQVTQERQEQKMASDIDRLLTQADQAYLAGNYIKPEDNNALQLYVQLLTLEPAHKQANSSVEKIIQRFDDSIRNNLADGSFDKAEKNLQLLLAAKPDSEKLIKLQNELEAAQIAHSRQLQLLALADQYMQQNSLLSPIGNNALSILRRVLEFYPDNKGAIQRIETITFHYVEQAKKDITAGKFSAAHKNIRNIKFIDDTHPEIALLKHSLANAKKVDKQQKLDRFLWLAKKSVDENRLLYPPQKNAFYLYQKVLDRDAGNIKAKNGIETVKAGLRIKLDGYLEKQDYSKAESLVILVEKTFPGSTFSKNIRAEWINKKPAPKSDIQIIEAMIGDFKQAFESRDQRALERMSEYQSDRKGFVEQLLGNYRSFKLKILNVKIIARKNVGRADIEITKLVNMQGLPVQPGTWNQFEIDIKKNKAGQWKVYW